MQNRRDAVFRRACAWAVAWSLPAPLLLRRRRAPTATLQVWSVPGPPAGQPSAPPHTHTHRLSLWGRVLLDAALRFEDPPVGPRACEVTADESDSGLSRGVTTRPSGPARGLKRHAAAWGESDKEGEAHASDSSSAPASLRVPQTGWEREGQRPPASPASASLLPREKPSTLKTLSAKYRVPPRFQKLILFNTPFKPHGTISVPSVTKKLTLGADVDSGQHTADTRVRPSCVIAAETAEPETGTPLPCTALSAHSLAGGQPMRSFLAGRL